MSGMFGLLFLALPFIYWGVIPLAAVAVVVWLWRRAHSKGARGAVLFLAVTGGMWLAWVLGEGEKRLADARVRELCAKDGGVKVYEQVKLPAEAFDKWGMVKFYDPTKKEEALGAEYVFRREITYFHKGDPDMFRMHTQVIRRSDGKLLGESVFYKRGGGDLPGPWHGSSFMCPELSIANDVLRQVFVGNT